MGLDMYLTVDVYIPRPVEWRSEEDNAKNRPAYEAICALLPGEPSEHSFGVNVNYVVAYWRKANAIHKWFVDNVQDGVDECQKVSVSVEQLNELLSVCHEVLDHATLIEGTVANGKHMGPDTGGEWVNDYEDGQVIEVPEKCEELLPTQSGCFFGGTGYDQWYLQDVRDTVSQIEDILTQYKDKVVDFYYQSSW